MNTNTIRLTVRIEDKVGDKALAYTEAKGIHIIEETKEGT